MALLLFAGLARPVLSGVVLETGTPQMPSELSTYGMQVETERAIYSVLPQSWHATFESGVALRGKVSWDPNDTWLSVLRRIGDQVDAGILIDWDARKVMVRHASATPGDASEREKVRQAAITPLPPLEPSASQREEQRQLPASQEASALAKHPAIAAGAAGESEAGAIAEGRPARAAALANSPARAFSRVSVRVPLEVLAARHDLTLRFESEEFVLPGPVTLMLGAFLEDDVELLERALGPQFSLAIVHFRADKELAVKRADSASFVSLEARPKQEAVARPFFTRLLGRGRNGVASAARKPPLR